MSKLLPAIAVSLLLTSFGQSASLQERFPSLVGRDERVDPALPREGVRLTSLGTNAYLFESRDAVILVDPYFSRMSLLRVALRLRTVAQPQLVFDWLRGVRHIDAVLVTHGHVDHLFDAPQIVGATGAKLIASETSTSLAAEVGVSKRQLDAVRPWNIRRVGRATVRVLPATHDRVLGEVPFHGPQQHFPPTNIDDW